MQHLDPETLALLALGEHPHDVSTDADRSHLDACAACSSELSALSEVSRLVGTVTEADVLVAPGPEVWQRIHAELELRDVSPEVPAGSSPPTGASADRGSRRLSVVTGERRPGRAPRPRRLLAWVSVAAAAALVAGAAGGILWERRESTAPEVTLASAALDALPAWPDASGQARLEESPDGLRQVVVEVDADATPGGYREVWLLADDLSGLVSLGVLEGTEGRFDVPAGLDVSRFSLVDVSQEALDGDPGHSGDSIVRGALGAAS